MRTLKLKYRTENETKRKYLTQSRDHVDGDMYQYAKYMEALKEKKNQIDHKKSVQILRDCESAGVVPNIVVYSKVLSNCSKCLAPTMVTIKVFEEMILKYGITPNCIPFSCLLQSFFSNKAYLDCILVFGLAQSRITGIDLKPLFVKYEKSREISYILSRPTLLKSIRGIEVNLICTNIVLKCLGKLGDMERVNGFFRAMIRSEMIPNDVTMNSLLSIFATNQCLDKMEKLFKWWLDHREMIGFPPDIVSINSMLSGYSKSGETEKAEDLFNRFCSKEHENLMNNPLNEINRLNPTAITFSHIITSAANRIDQIKRTQSIDLNSSINSDEMQQILKWRDFALKYYQKMQIIYGLEDECNSATTSVMNVCLKCDDLMNLLRIFEQRQDLNDKQMYQIAIRGLFHQGLIGEALCVFKEGADRNVLKYLSSTNGPYSMDLHLFDHSTAVVAVLHNLRVLCDVIRARVEYKIPTLWIITGRGKHVQKDGQGRLLKDVLPEMLKEERMFNPPLEYHVPHWNPGILKIDDESLLRYLSVQLKMSLQELRPRFIAFNNGQQTTPDVTA